MKTFLIPLIAFLLLITHCDAQKITISGTVKDLNTGENLIAAAVFNTKSLQGTTTNLYGFFSLSLNQNDSVHLVISYVGYRPEHLRLKLTQDTRIDIGLTNGTDLEEIVIEDTAEKIHESSSSGTIQIPLENIKSMPALGGEIDVLKVIQLLPGVQGGAEGSSGLYVRGGGPDQNLILLDGVPVYNASHLFGFFSVFNSDAINRVELIKGGFPARYGGRLSSVIDISMKEGNLKKFSAEGTFGLIASRLTVEGPIIKDRTSFIVSARRTYLDVLSRPFKSKIFGNGNDGGYYFYDLNAKINHRINDKNRIYLSAYTGKDDGFTYTKEKYINLFDTVTTLDKSKLFWGNLTTALRWNSILSNKLFANFTATYSRYEFDLTTGSEKSFTNQGTVRYEFLKDNYHSGIDDYAFRADFDYIPHPDHFIKFGAQAISHKFTPGVYGLKSADRIDTTLGAQITYAKEYFIYLENDFIVTSKLKMNAGVHASAFSVNGELYHSIQPRISGRYLIGENTSLKGSFATMTQYIHLLYNSGLGLPTDLWVPATEQIGPERSSLVSAGVAYTYKNAYEFSFETYYKSMDGLIEYKDGATFTDVERDWQTKVETGKGTSYGAEFFLQKKTGKLTGWAGYTLSWANRTFENINYGETFPYKYDRRHDVEFTIAYQWKKNREIGLTWVYGSGAATTLPAVTYYPSDEASPSGHMLVNYENRNNYRMRASHRLDLGYTVTKKTKFGERSWSFSLYNAYSRRNPFYVDVAYKADGSSKFVQYSLFPIIPSVSYRYKI